MLNWKNSHKMICEAPIAFLHAADLDSTHPATSFFKHWHGLNGGRMPDRRQFDPMRVPELLRWIMMFRRIVVDDVEDYLLFLQGDSAAEMTHGNIQGKFLSEFAAQGQGFYDIRRAMICEAIRTGEPTYAGVSAGSNGAVSASDVTMGAFPFADGGKDPQVALLPAPATAGLRSYL